ncbi:glycosyltransferase family A protein [Paratractidigestivibacter sp.]|uniref:glycosyltransferase family 2 protein n=1 Tax=Paratractidigestivibacter sp. TaxID=2847316 RepID=UPI002ABDFD9D|nr:glycosyltransferase family A protein [Paratractidigestivibacter sp.]
MSSSDSHPLVSVVVPVYNSEKYICRCLDSILGQTYPNIEVICVDDGSSDDSAAILDRYSVQDPARVIVVHQVNAGAAAARNNGVALACGKYLTFADNDDWLDADFVGELLEAALSSGADVVCSGYRRPDESGKIVLEAKPRPDDEWGPYVAEAAWAKLYRTDFIRDNHIEFLSTNILEDLYFSLPAVELANKVEVIRYCGYNWFWNTQSVSNTNQRTSEGLQFEQTLDALLSLMGEKGISFTPILLHYFVRLVAWFLLFTRKGDGWSTSHNNLQHYIGWLDMNVPSWRNDSYAKPAHPTGDAMANRLAVFLFAKHPKAFVAALKCYGLIG